MKRFIAIFAALLLLFAASSGVFAEPEEQSGPAPEKGVCQVCGCIAEETEPWYTDAEYHWRVCSFCSEIFDHCAHHGGEATCVERAVCEVCGEIYGETDPDNHKHTRVYGYKAASCTSEGATGVTVCDDCNQVVSLSEVIPKTDHVSDGVIYSDGEKHWYVCVNCGEVFGVEEHCGGEATCTARAVCEVCGSEYGELDPDNHKHAQTFGYKAPSCISEGFSGVTVCSDCNEVVSFGETLPVTDHTPDEEWHTDGEHHWHICTVCGDTCDEGVHSGGTADCSHKAKCADCGAEYGELDPENHCGPAVLKNYVKPTQHKDGYSGDTCCKACGAVLEKGEVLPATGVPDKNEYLLDSNITLHDDSAFKLGSIISLTVLDGGMDYEIGVESLHEQGKGRFIILDFSVTYDGVASQPIWPVGCTFIMPDDFTANAAVYKLSDTGRLTAISTTLDPFRRTADFEVYELGMYAVVDNSVTYGGTVFIPGDINGNQKIDPADYAMAKRTFLGTFELLPDMLKRGDINKNGKIDAVEYAMIKRHVLRTFVIPGAEGK
ncbi:MAG: dockerin type I repeat-containing protein [Clostridia bacterium]|nr:dockerin type I repeat-containing protein [Clostridia bacterium]